LVDEILFTLKFTRSSCSPVALQPMTFAQSASRRPIRQAADTRTPWLVDGLLSVHVTPAWRVLRQIRTSIL